MNEFICLLSVVQLLLMSFKESSLVCAASVVEKYQRETVERMALSRKIGLFWMKLIKGGTHELLSLIRPKCQRILAPLFWLHR